MKRAPLLLSVLAAAAGLGLAVLPADAADHTVSVSSNVFTPKDLTITQGDTVTWTNTDGMHNVRFDDGSFDMPPDPVNRRWTVQRTFNTAGYVRLRLRAARRHRDDGHRDGARPGPDGRRPGHRDHPRPARARRPRRARRGPTPSGR